MLEQLCCVKIEQGEKAKSRNTPPTSTRTSETHCFGSSVFIKVELWVNVKHQSTTGLLKGQGHLNVAAPPDSTVWCLIPPTTSPPSFDSWSFSLQANYITWQFHTLEWLWEASRSAACETFARDPLLSRWIRWQTQPMWKGPMVKRWQQAIFPCSVCQRTQVAVPWQGRDELQAVSLQRSPPPLLWSAVREKQEWLSWGSPPSVLLAHSLPLQRFTTLKTDTHTP